MRESKLHERTITCVTPSLGDILLELDGDEYNLITLNSIHPLELRHDPAIDSMVRRLYFTRGIIALVDTYELVIVNNDEYYEGEWRANNNELIRELQSLLDGQPIR